MNKRQLIVAWVMVVVIILLLGLQLVNLRVLDDKILFKDRIKIPVNTENKYYSIQLYGFSLRKGGFDKTKYIRSLVRLQDNKLNIVIAISFIGGLLIYTLRDKKK